MIERDIFRKKGRQKYEERHIVRWVEKIDLKIDIGR